MEIFYSKRWTRATADVFPHRRAHMRFPGASPHHQKLFRPAQCVAGESTPHLACLASKLASNVLTPRATKKRSCTRLVTHAKGCMPSFIGGLTQKAFLQPPNCCTHHILHASARLRNKNHGTKTTTTPPKNIYPSTPLQAMSGLMRANRPILTSSLSIHSPASLRVTNSYSPSIMPAVVYSGHADCAPRREEGGRRQGSEAEVEGAEHKVAGQQGDEVH